VGLARHQISCLICSRLAVGNLTAQAAAVSARLGASTPVGLLVERADGTTVGRFALGRHVKGRVRMQWPAAANGRRLKPGRYVARLRALGSTGVKAISAPVKIRVR
jgi:hypothetical protein